VQDNCLPFAKLYALHYSRALTVTIGLRKLAAENRSSSMAVQQFKVEQSLNQLMISHRQ
jgi:hypothetical protein